MIRFVLRCLVALMMLTSPVMASWKVAPSMTHAGQALGMIPDEDTAEGCLQPPSACLFCLAVLQDAACGVAVSPQVEISVPSADVLAGILRTPEPIPP